MLTNLLRHFLQHINNQMPVPALRLGPIVNLTNTKSASFSLQDILDGFLWATPKNRTPLAKKWRIKYGDNNWRYGIKLFQPKNNIVTCAECGNFHELHAICRTCFEKVNEESKSIIESIRNKWGKGVIDKEVKVLYQGENVPTDGKVIVEMDRTRPLWFAPNLSQKTAYLRNQIEGPAKEITDKTIKIKE